LVDAPAPHAVALDAVAPVAHARVAIALVALDAVSAVELVQLGTPSPLSSSLSRAYRRRAVTTVHAS
jgi:hypothetical protein